MCYQLIWIGKEGVLRLEELPSWYELRMTNHRRHNMTSLPFRPKSSGSTPPLPNPRSHRIPLINLVRFSYSNEAQKLLTPHLPTSCHDPQLLPSLYIEPPMWSCVSPVWIPKPYPVVTFKDLSLVHHSRCTGKPRKDGTGNGRRSEREGENGHPWGTRFLDNLHGTCETSRKGFPWDPSGVRVKSLVRYQTWQVIDKLPSPAQTNKETVVPKCVWIGNHPWIIYK